MIDVEMNETIEGQDKMIDIKGDKENQHCSMK